MLQATIGQSTHGGCCGQYHTDRLDFPQGVFPWDQFCAGQPGIGFYADRPGTSFKMGQSVTSLNLGGSVASFILG